MKKMAGIRKQAKTKPPQAVRESRAANYDVNITTGCAPFFDHKNVTILNEDILATVSIPDGSVESDRHLPTV